MTNMRNRGCPASQLQFDLIERFGHNALKTLFLKAPDEISGSSAPQELRRRNI